MPELSSLSERIERKNKEMKTTVLIFKAHLWLTVLMTFLHFFFPGMSAQRRSSNLPALWQLHSKHCNGQFGHQLCAQGKKSSCVIDLNEQPTPPQLYLWWEVVHAVECAFAGKHRNECSPLATHPANLNILWWTPQAKRISEGKGLSLEAFNSF